MSVLRGMRELAVLLNRTPVPAPHGIHAAYPPRDEELVRRLAADKDIAGRVGLTPRLAVGAARTGEGVDVRLSWLNGEEPIGRRRAALAVRTLYDLATAGVMPEPCRVNVLCALREIGDPARLLVGQAATLLGVRPVEVDGQVLVTRDVGPGVSYTVHGFLS
ncbi:hypothetical protein ABZ671_01600 [Micromonospora sp. NPDC006766]|uniref:hypothetical protein n=1 Tax=Micromonospora sp. NPDC006766 TaxID=3154778 RepID=UPI0034035F65